MSKVIELRLKIEAWKKKVEQAEAEMDVLYYQLDEEIESQLENKSLPETSSTTYESQEGIFLNKEQSHTLLCFLENTVISKDAISHQDRNKLAEFREDLAWDIADKYEYNLNEGSIDTSDYTYKTFKHLGYQV